MATEANETLTSATASSNLILLLLAQLPYRFWLQEGFAHVRISLSEPAAEAFVALSIVVEVRMASPITSTTHVVSGMAQRSRGETKLTKRSPVSEPLKQCPQLGGSLLHGAVGDELQGGVLSVTDDGLAVAAYCSRYPKSQRMLSWSGLPKPGAMMGEQLFGEIKEEQ